LPLLRTGAAILQAKLAEPLKGMNRDMWLDVLLILLVAAALCLALRKLIRDRRRGSSCSCGCVDCPHRK
jgi:hypothetical protein